MIDLNISRGLSTELFIDGELNPNIVLEEGCWYLCTDTAELFLCTTDDSGLILKQINHTDIVNRPSSAPSYGDGTNSDRGVIGAYISEATGELYLVFSDDTEESLGQVVGTDGKDGLTTSIKIGKDTYEQINGIIELPTFVTKDYIDEQIAGIDEQVQNIKENYVTEEHLTSTYVTNDTLETNYVSNTILEEKNFVTNTKVTELITNEVSAAVGEQIETKVTEVIEKKIEEGNIEVNADAINYDTW